MDTRDYNRAAWDHEVERGNQWTVPVGPEVIEAARRGTWEVVLTPTIPVPRDWFPKLEGADVLCLASGGGQQGPILAAAGGRVTVFDNSPRQLARDREVAEREGLEIRTVEGDMVDLSAFEDESFDLIFHPVSNVFSKEVRPVWREAFRILRPGGRLLAGFMNPAFFLFDHEEAEETGVHQVKYALPFTDAESPSEEKRAWLREQRFPLEHSHSLEDQIGGQADAGFHIVGFFEDRSPREAKHPIEAYMPTCIATCAVRLR